jgi:hypothetical protein
VPWLYSCDVAVRADYASPGLFSRAGVLCCLLMFPLLLQLVTFLNTCLQRDPKMRPDVTSLLMHPFVSHIPVPTSGAAAGGAGWSNPGLQFQNRPTTVAHSVVGEWDRASHAPSLFHQPQPAQQSHPASVPAAATPAPVVSTRSDTNASAAPTPIMTSESQVFTFGHEPVSRPLSARGGTRTALSLALPANEGNAAVADDPELALEVDNANFPGAAPAGASDVTAPGGSGVPAAGALAARPLYATRLAAINHPSSSPSSARSPKTRVTSGGYRQSPTKSAGLQGGSGGKPRRTRKKTSALSDLSTRDTDSPLSPAGVLGGAEAATSEYTLAAGSASEKATGAEATDTPVNEDDVVTPPTTMRIPKLDIEAAAGSLFHKSPLAPAQDSNYGQLKGQLDSIQSHFPPSGQQARSGMKEGGVQPKVAKKQHRRGGSGKGADFESFDSEDTSGWYAGLKQHARGQQDEDSPGAGADDDTLYSAEPFNGYSSAEGGADEYAYMSGPGASRTDRTSSSVRSRGDSNLSNSFTSSPVVPQRPITSSASSAFNSIPAEEPTLQAQEGVRKLPDTLYADVSSARGVVKPNFSKPQVITGPVSWKRLNNSRSQSELAEIATAGEKSGPKGTSVIKASSLQPPSSSGWRRQGGDPLLAVQAPAVPTARAEAGNGSTSVGTEDTTDALNDYDATLTKTSSYPALGDNLDGYGSAEEVADDSNTTLYGDESLLYGIATPSRQVQLQGPSRQSTTQPLRSAAKSGSVTRQRDKDREREVAPTDCDNPSDLSSMSISGMNFDNIRMSTAVAGQLGSTAGSGAAQQQPARTATQGMRSSHSRKALAEAASGTPNIGMSRHGSRQPLRTANRTLRDRERDNKDTFEKDADPLDMSCDSLDKLQVTGTTASKGERDREGTAKGAGGTRSSKRTAAHTASGSRRGTTAVGALTAADDGYSTAAGNLSASIDDRDDEPAPAGMFASPPVSLDEHTAAVTRLRAPERTQLLLSSSLDGTIRIWGPDQSAEGNAGSRAVLEATGFKTDNTYSAFADQRPERRVTLGAGGSNPSAGDDNSSVTGGNTARGAAVKVTNMWVDDTCETVWATCSDSAIRVWSGGEGRPLRLLRGHEDQITAMEGMDSGSSSASHLLQSSVSGNPSSCLVATGSADRTVRVWDVRAKKAQVFSFRGHGDTVQVLRWGEGGRSLVSAGKDRTVRIWDTRAGRYVVRPCVYVGCGVRGIVSAFPAAVTHCVLFL